MLFIAKRIQFTSSSNRPKVRQEKASRSKLEKTSLILTGFIFNAVERSKNFFLVVKCRPGTFSDRENTLVVKIDWSVVIWNDKESSSLDYYTLILFVFHVAYDIIWYFIPAFHFTRSKATIWGGWSRTIKEENKRKKPGTWRDMNPQPHGS